MSRLSLDPSTLLILISVLAFLMAAVSLSFDDVWTTDHFGLSEWGNSMAAVGASCLLFFLRGHVPWFLSFMVANALVLLVAPYAILAHARLFDVKVPRRLIGALLVFGLSGVFSVVFFDASRQVVVFMVAATMAIQLGLVGLMIYRATLQQEAPVAWISCGMMGMMATAFAWRAASSLLVIKTPILPMEDSLPQAGTLLVAALFLVGTSIGFFSMVNERRRRDTLLAMRTDDLTGLLTQAAFLGRARHLDTSAAPQPFAVVLVDVDHFQVIKDTFGHCGGELALAQAGALIAKSVSASDVAGRYGGDAFCIVLAGLGEAAVTQFMTRLTAAALQQTVRLRDGREVPFRLTAAAACRQFDAGANGGPESVNDVMERADQALRLSRRGERPLVAAAA